ncbi:hypothetical protein AGOR_G00144640 [Albula goreensis]|uniref:RGS domain-containing protein n=1 Tax=Albula goreensis TaxID=1534307 RepID=A0A8T3D1K2_9TELE|nr:hypothetical protein AGOR_G00144640 [Albula goreensis]
MPRLMKRPLMKLQPVKRETEDKKGSKDLVMRLLLTVQCRFFHTTVAERLKPEDMQLWSRSLEKLLESKYGMGMFQAFLRSEFSAENIEFWLICEDYKKIQSSVRMNCEAKRIYEMYIQAEAPKEINIDQQTRELIRGNLTAPTKQCFEDAQRVVYALMEQDSYPRFLKSNTYRALLNSAPGQMKE